MILAATLAASPALAQDADGAPALVDALVVNARTPGPAWWSVGKGTAKVWVLGLGGPVPANARWEDATFKRRVKATRRVISTVSTKANFPQDRIQADRPWIDELTDAERARLAQIAAETRRKADFYGRFRPNFAGILIKSELEARTKPRPGKSQDLSADAVRLGARLQAVNVDVAQGMKASLKAGEHDGLTCVRWAMRLSDPAATRRLRAEAWARGDVRTLLIGPTAYDPCVQAMSAMQASLEAQEAGLVEAIAASLDRGENAVALVALIPLLRQGGVLEQLRRRGYAVETPAQLDD